MLYLPIGVPGAGKSTYAQWLVDNHIIPADAVVCPDQYRLSLTGSMADQTVNGLVFQIVGLVAESRLSRGLCVYYDATNLKMADIKGVLDTAVQHGHQIRVVQFSVPHEESRRRNARRARPVPEVVMDRMIARYESFDFSALGAYPDLQVVEPTWDSTL